MPERTPLYDVAARAGAEFCEESGWLVPARFRAVEDEYRTCRDEAALFDQSHRGKVELRGPDARNFLHRLSSNDVAALPLNGGCELFLATAKAKVVAHAVAFVTRSADGVESLWLDLAPGTAEPTLRHLDRFLISEQIELLDRTRDFAQLLVAGPKARAALEQVLNIPVPAGVGLQSQDWRLADGPAGHLRTNLVLGIEAYDLVCPNAAAADLWTRLTDAGVRPAGADTYHVLRIEGGTPLFGVDITENNLAMEVGRTDQAISYKKGCFPGQEPIVRARDLGHVNWLIRGLRVQSDVAPAAGAKVFRDGAEVGRVTSSAVSPRTQSALALGYIRRGADAPGTAVTVETAGGSVPAEVAALPFSP